ncbi:hypothetical protein WN55_05491 [Dufourea novaeangliae]|uniref:Uncharacterized protein n=1 Tax=Dufourea novaeangliae TaxID=178035 RepID=A0A154PMJ2_DUFNO|nr:hypothetical protein WN55_05491 [Dufourea novaeangliae]
MVYTNITRSSIKGSHPDVRKNKSVLASSEYQQQQEQPNKNKYGSWGPVYKSKQNFIDMHLC